MAIGMFFDGVGISQAQYDQVLQQVMPGNERAPGLLHHLAGTTEHGIYVMEVWESQEALDRFVQEKLRPAFQAANMSGEPPKVFSVINMMHE
jgi:quinol monooxygenase YgiN